MHPSAFLIVWMTLWVSTHRTGGIKKYVFRALSLVLVLCCQSPAQVANAWCGCVCVCVGLWWWWWWGGNVKMKADKESYGLFPYNAKRLLFISLDMLQICLSYWNSLTSLRYFFIFFETLRAVLKNEWSYKREKSADLTRLPAPKDNDCAEPGHHYEYQRPTAKLNSGSSPHH